MQHEPCFIDWPFVLQVQPFAGILSEASQSTPRLLINREVVGPFASPWKGRRNDVTLKGDIVCGVKRLVKLLEWDNEMSQIVTEENENWKNRKQAEMEEKQKAKLELKESTTPSNGTQSRGYHTVSGKAVTQNSTSKPTLFPARTIRTNEKMNLEKLSNLGKNVNVSTKTAASPPGNVISGSGTSFSGREDTSSSPNTNKTTTNESLFRCNSVARREPLLPFRYTHRTSSELPGKYRSIDPKSDLACAGFGLGGTKDSKKADFYVDSSSDSDSSSSSSSSDSDG